MTLPQSQFRCLKIGFFSRFLLLLRAPALWLWPYQWKSILDAPFQHKNGKGSKIPVTSVRSIIIGLNDKSTLQVHCNCFAEAIFLICVFQCLLISWSSWSLPFRPTHARRRHLIHDSRWRRSTNDSYQWLNSSLSSLKLKRGQPCIVHAMIRRTLPPSVWRKRQSMRAVIVPWLAILFVLFVMAIFVRKAFNFQSASATSISLFPRPGCSICTPSGRTILTLSIACVSVSSLLKSLLDGWKSS